MLKADLPFIHFTIKNISTSFSIVFKVVFTNILKKIYIALFFSLRSAPPTDGVIVDRLDVGRTRIEVTDVGGQDKVRQLWRHYIRAVNVLIFVVDCHDVPRLHEAKTALFKLTSAGRFPFVQQKICIFVSFAFFTNFFMYNIGNESATFRLRKGLKLKKKLNLWYIPFRNYIYQCNCQKQINKLLKLYFYSLPL